MPDEIKRVDYYYAMVADKPGTGAGVLHAVRQGGISLLGLSAFPHGSGKTQVDLIVHDGAALERAAKDAKLKISKKKSGFLIQGEDRPGALAEIAGKLAQAKVNMTSLQAFCAGSGRYGGMLWVKAKDLAKAAKALGVG